MEKAQHGLDFFDSLKPSLGEGFSLSRQGQRRFLLRKYSNVAHRGLPPPLQSSTGSAVLVSETPAPPLFPFHLYIDKSPWFCYTLD